MGGTAIAETLFGDINPGGRLPISWAKYAGHLPLYYDLKPSGRGYQYLDDNGTPLFPFGYGLSYTTFEYSDLVVPPNVKENDTTEILVTVTNTGKVKGDEVVQLYIHDEWASVARPIKQLKDFQRVTLEAGESKQVSLKLPYRSLGLWNEKMQFVIEPGTFQIMIGKNAQEIVLEGIITAQAPTTNSK
jgi:beta-glucosidase